MFSKKPLSSIATVLLAGSAMFAGMPSAVGAVSEPDVAKSIVLLGTSWEGYIYVPAEFARSGAGFWTEKVTAESLCTGWFASKSGDLVTAGHCVDPAEGRVALLDEFLTSANASDSLKQIAIQNWQVEGATPGTPVERTVRAIQPPSVKDAVVAEATTAQIVDFRPFDEGDLALLKVSGLSKDTPALKISDKSPQINSPLTSIGFPKAVLDLADPSRIPQASFKSGTASSKMITRRGVSVLETSTDMSGGMSGGPTVNGDGQVVGVNSFGVLNPQSGTEVAGTSFITDTKDLGVFLHSHGVEFTGPAPKSGFPLLPVILGGIAAVLLAAVTTAMVLVLRRKTVAAPAGAWTAPTAPLGFPPVPPTEEAMRAMAHPDGTRPQPAPAGPMPTESTATVSLDKPVAASTVQEANPAEVHFCSNCGFQHHPEEKFCPNCGHSVA